MFTPSRIHYLASQALNGFETLDFETAVEMARADLEAILAEAVTELERPLKPLATDQQPQMG